MTHDCAPHACKTCWRRYISKGQEQFQHLVDYGSMQECSCKSCGT
jgi:hypothetical protein